MAAGGQEAESEPLSAATSALERYGWWNKAQQAPGGGAPVAAPPDAPSDGIFVAYEVVTSMVPGPVAGAPDLVTSVPGVVGGTIGVPVPAAPAPAPEVLGPTAFGAVRYSVPEGAEAQLVLRIASSTGTPNVLACPIASTWDGVQNGRFDQAPSFDCTSSATGVVGGDTITFEFPATLSIDLISFDVAIVPVGDQPFRLAIFAPTDASLLLTSVPETFVESEPFDESFDESFDDFGTEEEFSTDDGSTSDDLAGGTTESFTTFDDGTTFTAGPRSNRVPAAGAPSRAPGRQIAVPAGLTLNPFAKDASRAERIMAVGILLAMAAALWWFGGQNVRAPRLLGSLGAGQPIDAAAESKTGGIGRFARIRNTERPPRLF